MLHPFLDAGLAAHFNVLQLIIQTSPLPCQALRNCDCEMGTCKAGDNYAAQYEDHLLTLCPSGRGLAAFIGEGMGGMTASLQAPKSKLEL